MKKLLAPIRKCFSIVRSSRLLFVIFYTCFFVLVQICFGAFENDDKGLQPLRLIPYAIAGMCLGLISWEWRKEKQKWNDKQKKNK